MSRPGSRAGSAAGIEVAAVGRGAQLDAIRERGLTLWIGDERYDARIHATDRPETLGLAGCRLCRAEILDLAAGGPGDRAVARPRHQRRLRDERHSVVVSLSLPGERPAAPRPVASRPRRRAGAHDRARAGDRLHDRLGQRGRRAGGHAQFARHPQPLHAWRAGRQRSRAGSGRSRKPSSAPASAPRSAPRSATRSGKSCCATSAPARSAR